jgi:hypothetical protein
MMTEFLSEENAERVKRLTERTSLATTDTWIKWWSDKTIQIDGDLTLAELEILVTIMKGFK